MPGEIKKKELFERIESAIIEILGVNLEVAKGSITSGIEVDFSKKKLKLPQIFLNNENFAVEEIGVGSDAGIKKEENTDTFTGDGKISEFKLTKEPASIINVKLKKDNENKWENLREIDDRAHFDNFKIDYKKSIVIFRTTPEKGTEISVNYYTQADFSETKGLKFNLNYKIDVFEKSSSELNNLCTNIIKILLLERPSLEGSGILITLSGGESIGNLPDTVYGKSLKYLIETELIVELPPLKKMEEIEIRKRGEAK
ncbi:hypothetical protein BEH94_08615 [Candidatus Altiarchaeales archaeon WOR_SM1_SCG]|nr:hypothetical protein BEH94_08615 [Candidatus Altiarchaeales archaeon WOR_SM1_SCG]